LIMITGPPATCAISLEESVRRPDVWLVALLFVNRLLRLVKKEVFVVCVMVILRRKHKKKSRV
jgi:hypothetical protein